MKKAILMTLALTVLGGCLPNADCRTNSMGCPKGIQIKDYDAGNNDDNDGGGYDGGSGGGGYDGGSGGGSGAA